MSLILYLFVLSSLAGTIYFLLLLLPHVVFSRPLFPLPSKSNGIEKRPLQTFRPYNIAHRGSNGEIPEETAAAYLVQLRDMLHVLLFKRRQWWRWIRYPTSSASIFYELPSSSILLDSPSKINILLSFVWSSHYNTRGLRWLNFFTMYTS